MFLFVFTEGGLLYMHVFIPLAEDGVVSDLQEF